MFPNRKQIGGKYMEPEVVGKRVKKLMERNQIELQELANKMELTEIELNNKLEGKEEFYLDEMMKIKTIFELDSSDCDELFFQEDTETEKI